jgi:carboxylesterase type B
MAIQQIGMSHITPRDQIRNNKSAHNAFCDYRPFDAWVSQSPNVIIVSVYYRLDSLGFLAHPSFSSDPTKDSKNTVGDLNAGFLDQRLALNWVKQYIHTFGGDASKISIMGQSAGASSVELHIVATPPGETANLFRGAILQSVFRIPLPLPEQQVPLFEAYAQLAGCEDALVKDKAGKQDTSESSVEATVECLRAADLSALARAQDARKFSLYFTGGNLPCSQ